MGLEQRHIRAPVIGGPHSACTHEQVCRLIDRDTFTVCVGLRQSTLPGDTLSERRLFRITVYPADHQLGRDCFAGPLKPSWIAVDFAQISHLAFGHGFLFSIHGQPKVTFSHFRDFIRVDVSNNRDLKYSRAREMSTTVEYIGTQSLKSRTMSCKATPMELKQKDTRVTNPYI